MAETTVLLVFVFGVGVGFAAGYGTRAYISVRRRNKARALSGW